MSWITDIAREIAEHGAIVRVTVIRADGSTPRETGAAMLVGAGHIRDTIGGGALELEAIAHARGLIANAAATPPPASKASPSMRRGEDGTPRTWLASRDAQHDCRPAS